MKKITLLLLSFFAVTVMAQVSNGIAKGSIVTLADGTEISIEEIRKDDLLLSLKDDQSTIMVSRVINVQEETVNKLAKVTLANGMQILLTDNQIVLTDKGWTALDSEKGKNMELYKDAKVSTYKVDSFVYTLNANVKVEVLPIIDIEFVYENTPVYKLTLDSPVAYIANGVFVGQ